MKLHGFQIGKRRVLFAAVLTPLISLISVPSLTSVSPPVRPPDSAEFSRLESLVGWMMERPGRARSGASRVVRESDLVAAAADLPTRSAHGLFTDSRSTALPALPTALPALPLSLPFRTEITTVATRYRLDDHLLAAIVEVESSFDPRVVSPRGAMGLMQIMPSIARVHGVDDPFDPASNLDVGARHFSLLLEQFDGKLDLALAAYNAGPGAVTRFGGVPPYRETSRYVEKVLAKYEARRGDVPAAWRSAG
jgi:soluble lytic murein transglycosylase-like protein